MDLPFRGFAGKGGSRRANPRQPDRHVLSSEELPRDRSTVNQLALNVDVTFWCPPFSVSASS